MYFLVPAAFLAGGIGWFAFHVATHIIHVL